MLGHTENELDTYEILLIIEKLSHLDIANVHLLGGEPTARNDFIKIIRGFDKYEIDFGFNTNGLKLNRTDVIEEIISNKHLKNIVFSLEGPTAKINDSIRGKNVFTHKVANMKKIIQLKKENNRDDIVVTINTVLCKKNYNDIKEMIDFCIEMQVDEFVLLQFIVDGNAIENDESISFEDELETIQLIAEYNSVLKNKLRIVPRFTYPIAKLYSEKVLNREFPEIRHMCGAGTNFAYLNNKGELYPCDRYQNKILKSNDRNNISLITDDFWNIWSLDGYSDLFEKTEGLSTYENISPCNKCEFLHKDCFPCPESFCDNTKNINDSCSKLIELINQYEEAKYDKISSK